MVHGSKKMKTAAAFALCAFLATASAASALTIENKDDRAYYIKTGEQSSPIAPKTKRGLPCDGGCTIKLVDIKSGKAVDMISIDARDAGGVVVIRSETFVAPQP